jgi:phage gp36-like protein
MDDGETRKEVAMDVMNPQQAERETQRVHANREELVERIARAMREDGIAQPLHGFYLSRYSLPLKQVHGVGKPSVCVIAQGSKEVLFGESRYRYDPSQYMLATVELPHVSQVFDASQERPYLSLRLELAPPSSARSCLRPVSPHTPRLQALLM